MKERERGQCDRFAEKLARKKRWIETEGDTEWNGKFEESETICDTVTMFRKQKMTKMSFRPIARVDDKRKKMKDKDEDYLEPNWGSGQSE